ncbi:MAG: LCP family protein [Thermoleophilia bacterium]
MEDEKKPYTKYKSSRIRTHNKPLAVPSGDGSGDRPVKPPRLGRPGEIRRRRPGWGKAIGWFMLALLLVALAAAGIAYWRLDRAVRDSNAKVPADARQALKTPSGGISSTPVNILFMGSDQRPNEPARADTILLLRVNGDHKTISQLSIPRDTLVNISGYGEGKINSAYAYGGPALMIQAVQEFTGLPIHHYVELNFSGFPAIVDRLGGVDINVPKTIDSQYPVGYDWTNVHFDAGPQHMDGDRALVYVRVRYSDDDFQRMGRQQLFMEALQKKFTSPGSLARLPLISPDIVGNMITDISTTDLLRLGWIKFRTPADNNRKFVLAGAGENIGGVSYVVVDKNEAQATIRKFLAD